MRWLRIALALGVTAAALACGSGSGTGDAGPADTTAAPPAPASPVLVGQVPAGFRAVVAGRGTATQDWGSDETEGANPYTVLAPPGEDATSDRAVIVSTSGLAGSLGRVFCCREDGQRFRVDGRDAVFYPAGHGNLAQLAVVRGDELVVRVTAARGRRADLVAVARRVEAPADHTLAPTVAHPPSGLRVLGSVDAGALLSEFPTVVPGSELVPGAAAAYGTGWMAGQIVPADPTHAEVPSTPRLALASYPGRTADLAALPALARLIPVWPLTFTAMEVDGRPALLVEKVDDPVPGANSTTRTLYTHAPWGDLLVASADGQPASVPSVASLAAMLASARRATAAEWDAFVRSTH